MRLQGSTKYANKSEREQIYADSYTGSGLTVRVFEDPQGDVRGVILEIMGALSRLPAKSNSGKIRSSMSKWGRTSTSIIQDPKVQARTKALTDLYIGATVNQGHLPPAFRDEQILVSVYMADSMNRQDRHNVPKFVGDWLESIGIIENDRTADIQAHRKTDFPQLFQTAETTEIWIQRRRDITEEMEGYIRGCACAIEEFTRRDFK